MYLVFALCFLLSEMQKGRALFKSKVFSLSLIVFFSVFNFMLASKMGWLCFIFIAGFLFCKQLIALKKIKLLISGFLLVCVAMFSLYKFVRIANEKVNNLFAAFDEKHIDPATTESSAVRVLVWKSASQVISENFWYGTGSGNAETELIKVYDQHGYIGAKEKKLNAHNQFLEVFVALGFYGFLLFCSLLLLPLFIYKGKFPMYGFWFLLIVMINFSVESMLQTQAGVVFFAFFYSVILIGKKS
ncbi:MAG: O-antigen ligase family protein [Bacteroidia bacterium]|nr:O-antigen ligase family protein [Bacteroidia bacterium]